MNRRTFLTGIAGILAAGVAPAVLPSGIIMPVRKLWVPDSDELWHVAEFAEWWNSLPLNRWVITDVTWTTRS